MFTDYHSSATAHRQASGSEGEKAGSTWTAESVFHEHAPRVYNLARRMLNNEADAEDVTQDVLLQVVRKLNSFRGEAEMATWLHRVTVNAALALRRRRARRPEMLCDAPLDSFPAGLAGPHRTPQAADLQAIDRETHALLERAIAQLPEIYRDVYLLSDVEGVPNAEIGQLLGLSLPAVKSRLHRARLLLRDSLSPHFQQA